MITVKQIGEVVAEIARMQHDDEGQHSREDKLYVQVLEAIADPKTTPRTARRLAREALKTQAFKFHRWTG